MATPHEQTQPHGSGTLLSPTPEPDAPTLRRKPIRTKSDPKLPGRDYADARVDVARGRGQR